MWASLGPRPDSKCSKTEHLEPLCCGALGLMRQYCLLFISLSISPCRRTGGTTAAAWAAKLTTRAGTDSHEESQQK